MANQEELQLLELQEAVDDLEWLNRALEEPAITKIVNRIRTALDLQHRSDDRRIRTAARALHSVNDSTLEEVLNPVIKQLDEIVEKIDNWEL